MSRSKSIAGAAVALLATACLAFADAPPTDLTQLSLDQLLDVEVTSVSKVPERRSEAAAAIAVITGEDIRRSGVTTLPDALRMAPGLHVSRVDAHNWEVASRGFSTINSGKLLVLMDGRSIYTPLFSGVFWDVQDTFLEDVDRIEVIRGPGGTLWGANAMNGVVNITTKSARDTQGWLVDGGGGTEERGFGGFRYGGKSGDLYYRFYGKYFDRDGGFDPDSLPDDRWHEGRVGFRTDWSPGTDDSVTLQGDFYDGSVHQSVPTVTLNNPDGSPVETPNDHTADVSGGNVLGRWTRRFGAASDLTVQAYYDRTDRDDPLLEDDLDTFDVDVQHRLPVFEDDELLWGISYRLMHDRFRRTVRFLALDPSDSNDQLASGFVQDELWLFDRAVRLTAGTKLEHNDFSGWEVQPSGRVAWTPNDASTVWGAVSRAVRTPTRIERDILLRLDDPSDEVSAELVGNHDLDAEQLVAYEVGYRIKLRSDLFVDLAAFYNDYDKLVTQEPSEPEAEGDRVLVRIRDRNKAHGSAYGGEVAVDFSPVSYWRLAASYSALRLKVRTELDSTDTSVPLFSGSSPENQFQVRSLLDLPHDFALDGWIRWVDHLSTNPDTILGEPTPSYWNLDLRLGWRPRKDLDVSVVGQNLVHDHRREFPGGTEVKRGAYGKVTWHFDG